MMGRIRQCCRGRALLAAVACLVGQVGCQTLSEEPTTTVPAMGSLAGGGKSSPTELPPKETAEVCIGTAETLAMRGQDREAIALFEKARVADPSQRQLCHPLALLYDRSGQFNKALVEYARALEIDPTNPDLHNDLGYAFYNRGKWDKAEQHLRQAVQLDPAHERAWVNLGMTYGQQGRYNESLEAFERAVPPGQARANVAFILTTQGRYEDARLGYEAALRLEPELDVARSALAKLDHAGGAAPMDRPARHSDIRTVAHEESVGSK